MNHVNLAVLCLEQTEARQICNEVAGSWDVYAGKCTLHAEANIYAYKRVIYFIRFYIFILHKYREKKKKKRKEGVMFMNLIFCFYIQGATSFILACHA